MAERKDLANEQLPKFTELNDLISERNGGKILFATDDWFAVAENLLKDLILTDRLHKIRIYIMVENPRGNFFPNGDFKEHTQYKLPQFTRVGQYLKSYADEPEWHEGEFTEFGKWMDGWETRRKRIPGHDWAIIKLGVPGVLHGVTVDTAFFTGNYAPRFSLQAAYLSPKEEAAIPHRNSRMGSAATSEMLQQIAYLRTEDWDELIPATQLNGGYKDSRYNHYKIGSKKPWTHVRLNIYPDGGVARLRLYGEAHPDWRNTCSNKIDLIAMVNGGVCVGYSDAHYGHPRNIIGPGRGINMGDGWETARRLDRPHVLRADIRGILQVPGCEWAVFRLGHRGIIKNIEVDTNHFRGNFPDSILIEGAVVTGDDWSFAYWQTLLPHQKLSPHKQHFYSESDLQMKGPFTHVRVTIAPDGGISRLRLWGQLSNNL